MKFEHNYIRPENLDSNGNIIRGRKLDSPQLVIVKEAGDLEVQDVLQFNSSGLVNEHDNMVMLGFNSDQQEMSRIWKSKEKTTSERKKKQLVPPSKPKSQDKRSKSKSQQKQYKKANNKENQDIVNIDLPLTIGHAQSQAMRTKGTKSSREIISSMGFNELLNQLDKDVSIQQSNQFDFKNRTMHDLLKLELSAVRRQNSSGAGMAFQNKIHSKSQEKLRPQSKANLIRSRSKSHEKKTKIGDLVKLPKSILKKQGDQPSKDQVFQYQFTHLKTEVTPDRNQNHQGANTASFLHSEHGRCVTSQGVNQSQVLFQQNGRTNSQPNISGTLTNNINVLFSKIRVNKSGAQISQNTTHARQQFSHDQGSPDRSREFRMIGNIDKLVRDNIKRMKSKEDEENMQKLMKEQELKKKRDLQEKKNSMVRKINKEKTYKKNAQSSCQYFQQSQDLSDPLNKLQKLNCDDKANEITKNIYKREKFIQKSSQTQKIDFEKIKESAKGKKLNLKNHRKSYGLEFMEIKKEIQQELRTIDEKYKHNKLHDRILEETLEQDDSLMGMSKPKKLKVKAQKKKDETQILSQGSDQFISERIQPIDKVIVVKKDKIRKYMREKKKNLLIQKIKEQKDEMVRTMKMQENIIKLNNFYKKKVIKNIQKRKNATIEVSNTIEDGPKLSARKINFEEVDGKRVIYHKVDHQRQDTQDLEKDDSSRLSTEFYEEYFRLINSIKKEQEFQKLDNQSRLDTSSNNITTKSYHQLLRSPTNKSPIDQPPKVPTIAQPSNQSKPKSQKKDKPKSIHKGTLEKQRAHSKVSNQAKLNHQQHSRGTLKSTDTLKLNVRAESAPLFMNQNNSFKKKPSPQKLKKGKIIKKQKPQQIFNNEQEYFNFLIGQVIKIQTAYRIHLYKKGFYNDILQIDESKQENQSAQEGSKQSEFQTQVFNGNQQDSLDPISQRQESERGQNKGDEEDDDYDDEQDEPHDLIIINQQSQDDNKIVYMSNLNSCSLPQTPKMDEVPKPRSTNLQLPKVFDYKPGFILEQDQFFSQGFSMNDQIHQSISQKPSIQTPTSDALMEEQFRQTVQRFNQDSGRDHDFEEEKKADYGMRLIAGSESLLREFKNNTPKQPQRQNDKNLQKPQESQISSSNSGASQNLLQIPNVTGLDSKSSHSNSHSSQSLFERNSFQQFTMRKLDQMMKNNEYMNLIEIREKALDYRQDKEKKFIKKMYKNNQISPRTYSTKKEQLERWVQVERDEIQKTKHQFQEEWQKTLKIIEETQKNVDNMREKMKIQIDNNHKHSHLFQSQSSRNSSSSYATISKQEQRKSILEQEEYQPISSRSIKQSIGSDRKVINITDQKSQKVERKTGVFRQSEEEEKLIDFLERSFNKNQTDDRFLSSQKVGIYIEDQNQVSESQENLQDKIDEFINSEGLPQQDTVKQLTRKDNDGTHEERPLTRSRSEQDLSDLIKKSKLNIADLENYEDDNLDSYRVQPNQPKIKTNNEIKIQENLFEDSSNRYSKGKNYYQDMNDLQSNDSLLNESELNNYFQDQKFSIEDFKSLDKRKILEPTDEDEEEENLLRNESQVFLDQAHASLTHSEKPIITDNDQYLFAGNQSQQIQNDPTDSEPSYIDSRRNNEKELENQQRATTPEIQSTSSFMQHHQAFLFNNAKPGENIRISDILKKNQSQTDPSLSTSQIYGNDTSQILFQNQQIKNSMVLPASQPLIDKNEELANLITEELIKQLLSTEVAFPSRFIEQAPQQQLQLQEPVADVFIIDAQKNDKEQAVQIVEFRQRVLIEKDLIRVENYINEVIQALQQAELQYLTKLSISPASVEQLDQHPNYHRQFLLVLTQPIRKNELEQLNQLQTSEIGSYEHFETTMDPNANPILPIDLYLEIERLREESNMMILQRNGMMDLDMESSVIQESVHIHNKAIFDSLNESLLKFRPYGIQGEPMPWSNKNRRLQTKVDANSVDTERLFMMVKQDVLRWASTCAGCHPSQVFVVKRNPDQPHEQFDEEIFQELRERRLANQLATEVVESEHQWLNYEFEEAQVKIDLSDMILEHLVEEVAVFLNQKHGIKEE